MHKTQERPKDGFKKLSRFSTQDDKLDQAMKLLDGGLILKRKIATEMLENYQELVDRATEIRRHTFENWDVYLEMFEKNAKQRGSEVHWCHSAEDALETILNICKQYGVENIVKGKSMATEEIGLNHFLENNGIKALETDLGEYLVQLRGETPSHLLAPAIHITQEDAEETFRKHHLDFNPDRVFSKPEDLVGEARTQIRKSYFQASMGITGANFLIADTGGSVIVTNEGNGDLSQHLPKCHLVVSGIDKIIPSLNDMSAILRVLARSATGQEMSVYTTISTGAKSASNPDGPVHSHIILLDNGRSPLINSDFSDMLRCIRCSACMNHCPVYRAAGGHAYNSTYVGPMGSVLSPAIFGLENYKDLPFASSFCGKCVEVCPVSIPLTKLMRQYRNLEWQQNIISPLYKFILYLWTVFAKRPKLYRIFSQVEQKFLNFLGGSRPMLTRLPFVSGWSDFRHLPKPPKSTFQNLWKGNRE